MTEELKTYLQDELGASHQRREDYDGVFWIKFENFIKFFYYTSICLYHENYQQICLSDTHGQHEHALTKLIVHEDIDEMFIIKI